MTQYETIYLVDDFEMVNLLHAILLRNLGMGDKVNSFTNPEDALKDLCSKTRELGPTLILLDINMPEMSGFEFLECMVREEFPQKMDVIIVTSSVSEMDKALSRKYPQFVRDFISKPLKIEQLRDIVEPVN
ncbi:MAG TPA: response regulator [Gillisia sp.]|nr:response regulator [Gillisia sp.]